jgi:hypothetical protein
VAVSIKVVDFAEDAEETGVDSSFDNGVGGAREAIVMLVVALVEGNQEGLKARLNVMTVLYGVVLTMKEGTGKGVNALSHRADVRRLSSEAYHRRNDVGQGLKRTALSETLISAMLHSTFPTIKRCHPTTSNRDHNL